MFQFIANIFGYLLEWLYNGIGQNYGIAFVYYNTKNYIITINYKTTEIHEKDN